MPSVFVYGRDLVNDVGVGPMIVILIWFFCMNFFLADDCALTDCVPSTVADEVPCRISNYRHSVDQKVFPPTAAHADRDFYIQIVRQ
jgi:hypothetical protein